MPAPRSGAAVLVVGPELQRRPPLDAVGAVLGREQGLGELHRGAVGAAEDRGQLLVAVGLAARPGAPRSARRGRRRRRRSRSTAAGLLGPRSWPRLYSPPRQAKMPRYEPSRPVRPADPERDAASLRGDLRAPRRGGRRRPSRRSRPTPRGDRAPGSSDYAATHAWLVAERDGEVVGFAYACGHRARPAYRWSVDVSVYVGDGPPGRGRRPGALRGALRATPRARASASPAPGSRCPTRRASPCTRASGSRRSASTGGSAGRPAPGATSAGGSSSCEPPGTGRRPSRCSRDISRLPLADDREPDRRPDRRRRHRGARGGHRPRAGPRLRLPRPRLRRRDREARTSTSPSP